MNRTITFWCIAIGALAIAVSVGVVGAEATNDLEEDAYVVELSDDGSATVSLVFVYDLTSDEELQAFTELEEDQAAVDELLNRYVDRMSDLAQATATDADREMSVVDGSIELYEQNNRGIVVQSVTWNGLAAIDGDRLVLSEPFDAAVEGDRTLVVVGPAGFEIEDVNPETDETDGPELRWDGTTDRSGFEVVFTGDVDADDGMPALGPVGVVVGIGATVMLLRRR